jgi:zinc protease
MGHLGLRRDNPDFYPVLVMNYILGGGGFTSRVVKSVRDDQGLAYSIYSGFDAKRSSGSFSVVFQTQNSNANQAIDSVLKELARIRQEPVTEQELDEAKSYLSGSFPLRLDTNRKTAHLLTFIEIYGLGLGYFDDYVSRIRAVTPEDVSRVAKRYLDPQNMIWVVVGNQEEAAVVVP